MMSLHPGFYNLEKYEEFVAKEVLFKKQIKMAKTKPLSKKGLAKNEKCGMQTQFA